MWHFGFNRVSDAVELLLPGREAEFIALQFRAKSVKQERVGAPEIYAEPWKTRERLLGTFAYYRDLERTVVQNQTRGRTALEVPVLAVGGVHGAASATIAAMNDVASNVTGVTIQDCGHYVPEEQPDLLSEAIRSHVRQLHQFNRGAH
jgi:pimeloyl-ACP methyl ester carboxylesterase